MTEPSTPISRMREDAREIFQAGVDAAEPREAVRRALQLGASGRPVIAGEEIEEGGRLRIIGLGKASCSMAAAAAEVCNPEQFPGPGIVVVNAENRRELSRFRVRTSGHPVPDAAGVRAAEEIVHYLQGSSPEDTTLVLISGGGSALLPAPAEGISLEDKMETTRHLLACGATIQEMNMVRKHVSRLKGGGLARHASPTRVEALILSDVIGDDLSTIASGPTVADPTTFDDARGVLEKYGILDHAPAAVRERIENGCRGEIPETPKPGDPAFEKVRNVLVGGNGRSLDAVVRRAGELGYQTITASRQLTGEARNAAVKLAHYLRKRSPASPPLAIVAGGETTVTVQGDGKGGRNQEMALSFALACEHLEPGFPWVFLSGATDGQDGPTDAAGGMVDPGSLERGRMAGWQAADELENNNSYVFLEASGDLLKTGATSTNVADLQILLVR